jgi:hypothetical protein
VSWRSFHRSWDHSGILAPVPRSDVCRHLSLLFSGRFCAGHLTDNAVLVVIGANRYPVKPMGLAAGDLGCGCREVAQRPIFSLLEALFCHDFAPQFSPGRYPIFHQFVDKLARTPSDRGGPEVARHIVALEQ